MTRPNLLAYDWGLLSLVAFLSLFGLFNLKSAASDPSLFVRQVVALGLGISALLGVQLLDRKRLLAWACPLYALSLSLLALVLVAGREINGAKAWLVFGPLQFQPSELAKIALLLVLGKSLEGRPIQRVWDYALPLAWALPVLGLVLVEPDLGMTLVLLFGVFTVLFVRGLPWGHLLLGSLLVLVLLPTLVWPNLKPYQRERVLIVLDPYRDPLGQGFQVIQSTIAIGSGGFLGKGYGQGTQTQLGFVPFRHTDFIFAVLAEEWGFVGAVGVLALYLLLILRLFTMALECPRLSDRLILSGIGGVLGFQAVANVGVALGLLPVTGLTLPLFSYGGSSLVMTFLALGVALLLHRDRLREV